MVLSASSVDALRHVDSGWTYFLRQALWTVLGVGALLVADRLPHLAPGAHPARPRRGVRAHGRRAVPGIGTEVNGARAWFHFGPFGFQPSEVLKLALLLYAADLLARRADRMHDLRATFRPLMLVLALAAVLVMLQPDLGSAIVLVTIVLGVAFVAGTPLLPLGAAAAAWAPSASRS